MVDITDLDYIDETITSVIYHTRKLPVDNADLKYLNSYFSNPTNINVLKIGNKKVLFITEDDGLYSFCGARDILDKIANSFKECASEEGSKAKLEYVNYYDDQEFLSFANTLLS